jgi:hypothetical protein
VALNTINLNQTSSTIYKEYYVLIVVHNLAFQDCIENMFNCTKRTSRNYAKQIFQIRLKNVVVLVKQMCDGRTDGRTNANKIFLKFCVSCTITPYPFIFINDSIPYSILNIRRMW